MTRMSRGTALLLAGLSAALCAPAAWANRVALDRDRIDQNGTVNLVIDLDDARRSDLTVLADLRRDFAVVGQTMSRQEDAVSGRVWLSMQLTLQPLHAGTIAIPTADITGEDTAPLRLVVAPARDVVQSIDPADADAQVPVFVEARVDTATPYVQQSVGYTLRMYYDDAVIPRGTLAIDPPDGASLVPVPDERKVAVRSGSRTYQVVERHYVLVPERGGKVTVPAPAFVGQIWTPENLGMSGQVRIAGKPIALQVHPLPANAPQPWLPLRAAVLRYRTAPTTLREGEAATVEVELVATGASAASLPALALVAGDGAQVIPDRAETRDAFVDGAPQATVSRRFTVLPVRSGTLRIVGPRIAWWDVASGRARVASLPDLVLPVAVGVAGRGADGGAARAADAGVARRLRAWLDARAWHWMLAGLPLVWLSMAATLFAIRRWRQRAPRPLAPPPAPARVPVAEPAAMSSERTPPLDRTLQDALASGDLARVAAALCAAAPQPGCDPDGVREQLDDPRQRAAVDALQQARWGGGDASAALDALRRAFADGPRWRAVAQAGPDALLPPLYPPG